MSDYTSACVTAAVQQGLGGAYMLLHEAGVKPVLWQSGGWTMILTVPLHFPGTDRLAGEVWITAEEGEDGPFLVTRKRARYVTESGVPILDEMGDDDPPTTNPVVVAASLVDHVQWLAATFEPNDGIEQQWVDTNDLINGMPRVLSFDECDLRGLDGTGRQP